MTRRPLAVTSEAPGLTALLVKLGVFGLAAACKRISAAFDYSAHPRGRHPSEHVGPHCRSYTLSGPDIEIAVQMPV
jgi:hypothetical protein